MTGSTEKPSVPDPLIEQDGKEDVVDIEAVSEDLTLKEKAGDAANRWLAKNRSLVLRQTPVWAQSLAVILILLGTTSLAAAIVFRIDEVVTATGQLKSIGGTIEVKTPTPIVTRGIFHHGLYSLLILESSSSASITPRYKEIPL